MLVALLNEAPSLHKLFRWAALNVHALAFLDASLQTGHGVTVEALVVKRRLLFPKPRSTNQ